MATNSPGDNAIKSVSMPPDLAQEAEARAKRLGFGSFSAYIQRLIEQDLREGGSMVIHERQAGQGQGKPVSSKRPSLAGRAVKTALAKEQKSSQ